MPDLLEQVKTALRIGSNKYDTAELQPMIEACLEDMKLAGVTVSLEKLTERPLVRQAIILYCKAYFGFGDDTQRCEAAYKDLRNHMAISKRYGAQSEGEDQF